MPSNAIYFASILGVQRFCCKSLELLRRRPDDLLNELFGFAMVFPYYQYCLNHSERRLILHNRVVGGLMIGSIGYANLLA